MNPSDAITWRLSNQPVNTEIKEGVLYTGIFDCFKKIVKKDGVSGLFRGL